MDRTLAWMLHRRPRLHWAIFWAIDKLIALNTRVYGASASREVLQDLSGMLESREALKEFMALAIVRAVGKGVEQD